MARELLSSGLLRCRVVWAFARDGALPMSSVVRKVHAGSGVPINAVVLSVVLSVLISLPLLSNTVAFYACVSIAILGEFPPHENVLIVEKDRMPRVLSAASPQVAPRATSFRSRSSCWWPRLSSSGARSTWVPGAAR